MKTLRTTSSNELALFAAPPAIAAELQASNRLAGSLTLKRGRWHNYEGVDLAIRSAGRRGAAVAVQLTALPWS